VNSFTVSPQQVRSAPPTVRRWIENEIAANLRALTATSNEQQTLSSRPPATSIREEDVEATICVCEDFVATLHELIGWWRQLRIRERAYELWEWAGRPEGKAVEHWLQAEDALRHEALTPHRDLRNLPTYGAAIRFAVSTRTYRG
jgi:hypothetical protein